MDDDSHTGSGTKVLSQKKLIMMSHELIQNIEKIKPEKNADKRASKQGFYTLKQTEQIFAKGTMGEDFGHGSDTFSSWFKSHEGPHLTEGGLELTFNHYDRIQPGDYFDCNLLTDEWFKWFLTTPRSRNPYSNPGETLKDEKDQYGVENVFLMQIRNSSAYFTTAAPFQKPDERIITLTVDAPLLVPVYNVCASNVQFPSLNPEPMGSGPTILDEVISDLLGIKGDTVSASLDGQTIEPCCVIRKEPLTIEGIPIENVFGIPSDRLVRSGSKVSIVHGGFWAFIKPESIGPGDHILEWNVESVNYKMQVLIRINAQV